MTIAHGSRVRVVRYNEAADFSVGYRDERARFMPSLLGRIFWVVDITDAHGKAYFLHEDKALVRSENTGAGRRNPVRDRADVWCVDPSEVEEVPDQTGGEP